MLAALLLADFLVGMYVVVWDELIKEWRLVRTKPYQMELDDALALTDEEVLAKDMSALRAGRAEGRSYYMEVRCLMSDLRALECTWNKGLPSINTLEVWSISIHIHLHIVAAQVRALARIVRQSSTGLEGGRRA